MNPPSPPIPALHAIGWPWQVPQDWQALLDAHPQARLARVAEQHRGGYRLCDGADRPLFTADSPPDWQRELDDPLQRAGVGDWVLVEADRITGLLPRRSALKRAAAGEHYRQQLIAANIDTAFVVCGLDADFNPRRIERYLLLVRGGGVTPVVVLTKTDLGSDVPGAMAGLLHLGEEGVPVRAVNAKDADSVATLAPWLQPGCTVVLAGSSGAGKSTLTNTLLGEQRMKTGAVRTHDSRGRHTTTHRALVPLPGGACLIDTPGMRELKPTGEESLQTSGFADIETLAADCRFRDCRHAREPGCAVRIAVESGMLDGDRLANWRKLHDEVSLAANALAARHAMRALNLMDRKRGKH